MLFIKDSLDKPLPSSVYLFSEDMEDMVRKKVDSRLSEHGYPICDHDNLLKDMIFLRYRRLFHERLIRQIWTLIIRGCMLGLGGAILFIIKDYITL